MPNPGVKLSAIIWVYWNNVMNHRTSTEGVTSSKNVNKPRNSINIVNRKEKPLKPVQKQYQVILIPQEIDVHLSY
jgi:hypothetical protein